MPNENKTRVLSRPADRSLEAFKKWITDMVAKINPNAPPDDTTDEEWEADWKKFWSNAPAEDQTTDQPAA